MKMWAAAPTAASTSSMAALSRPSVSPPKRTKISMKFSKSCGCAAKGLCITKALTLRRCRAASCSPPCRASACCSLPAASPASPARAKSALAASSAVTASRSASSWTCSLSATTTQSSRMPALSSTSSAPKSPTVSAPSSAIPPPALTAALSLPASAATTVRNRILKVEYHSQGDLCELPQQRSALRPPHDPQQPWFQHRGGLDPGPGYWRQRCHLQLRGRRALAAFALSTSRRDHRSLGKAPGWRSQQQFHVKFSRLEEPKHRLYCDGGANWRLLYAHWRRRSRAAPRQSGRRALL